MAWASLWFSSGWNHLEIIPSSCLVPWKVLLTLAVFHDLPSGSRAQTGCPGSGLVIADPAVPAGLPCLDINCSRILEEFCGNAWKHDGICGGSVLGFLFTSISSGFEIMFEIGVVLYSSNPEFSFFGRSFHHFLGNLHHSFCKPIRLVMMWRRTNI